MGVCVLGVVLALPLPWSKSADAARDPCIHSTPASASASASKFDHPTHHPTRTLDVGGQRRPATRGRCAEPKPPLPSSFLLCPTRRPHLTQSHRLVRPCSFDRITKTTYGQQSPFHWPGRANGTLHLSSAARQPTPSLGQLLPLPGASAQRRVTNPASATRIGCRCYDRDFAVHAAAPNLCLQTASAEA
jgi:hypothetical protein